MMGFWDRSGINWIDANEPLLVHYMDFPDCLLLLLSISVFFIFLVFFCFYTFLVVGTKKAQSG